MFFFKYLVHFYKRFLSQDVYFYNFLSNILFIFRSFLYQISCPFLQTFFIKYLVHFFKCFLSNIISIFTNVLYQISCSFFQTFFIKYVVHFSKLSLSNILFIFSNVFFYYQIYMLSIFTNVLKMK